ncbi:hypothetical protein QWI50_06390 [Acinetobacter baumannii]|uniref:hypothetical protein n=1 Tax=Acinetobacter baumannii TaxID=470 RepID=UPI00274070EE|nr:hypothetical protein [Acinetobacter baumannii]MDP7809009.1 hypothetical protein [Acinetobacter baumannii]
MMKKQLLCCCIASVLFLGGCSKKDEPQTAQGEYSDVSGSGETETETVATSPVILSKTAVQPLPLIDGDILGNFPEDDYRYPSPARFPLDTVDRREDHDLHSFDQVAAIFRQNLKLRDDQVVVMGRESGPMDGMDQALFDLTSDQLYQSANNLAINYVRMLKTPIIKSKGEFETTEQYQLRVEQTQAELETYQVDYDVNLLQNSLNKTMRRLYVQQGGVNPDYQYDADQGILTLKLEENASSRRLETLLTLPMAAADAQELVKGSGWARAYIMDFKQNHLKVSGVLFFKFRSQITQQQRVGGESLIYTQVYKPIKFEQKSIDSWAEPNDDFTTQPFQDVLNSPRNQFEFGLKHYLPAETYTKQWEAKRQQAE